MKMTLVTPRYEVSLAIYYLEFKKLTFCSRSIAEAFLLHADEVIE
jgi:hypothetical protein